MVAQEPCRVSPTRLSYPLKTVPSPVMGWEHGMYLLQEHGSRLAWEGVGSPLVQAQAGEGSGDGLREHRTPSCHSI